MTHPLAALLKDVPRYITNNAGELEPYEAGYLLMKDDVLAALEAAPVPDLVEEAGEVEANLRNEGTIATRTEAADTIRALIALATAQAAQIAGLEKDRNAGAADYCALMDRHDELHNALAAERAKVAKLVEALNAAEAWIVDGGYLDDKDPYTAESAASIYGQTRAVIKEAQQ